MSMVNTQKVCLYGSILLVDYYYIMKTKRNTIKMIKMVEMIKQIRNQLY